MKFPNHIVLDINKLNTSHSSEYWVFRYLSDTDNLSFIDDLFLYKKFSIKPEKLMLNGLLKSQKKYTVKYSKSNLAHFLSSEQKKLYKSLYAVRPKVKHRLVFSTHYGRESYDYLYNSPRLFNEKLIRRLFKNFKHNDNLTGYRTNNLWTLFDVNFFRKEKIYTKLKYSRVPQYDIVSAGVAAIFAGFIGFLITEKFGFELVDSGDFYYLFMYLVFFFFFLRTFLSITTNHEFNWTAVSYKWVFYFYKTIFTLFLKFIKNLRFWKKN